MTSSMKEAIQSTASIMMIIVKTETYIHVTPTKKLQVVQRAILPLLLNLMLQSSAGSTIVKANDE